MADTRSMPPPVLGGRYTLGPLLGRGGMADVHRAWDERLHREIAVKLFRPEVAEARDLRRVRSEIRTLASLNHPALVTLHDAADGDDGSPAYLVLELVDGSNLASLLREDAVSADEVVALITEVAAALAYIHARGIVHRDVKPENILVFRGDDGTLHAKLADLGIARIVHESHLTEAGAVIGTAAYLSPEQVLGAPVGTATDVYSLGLVLLEALTGRRSFGGTRVEATFSRTSRDPEIPAGLAADDRALLARMTSRSPENRSSAAEAAAGLRRWRSSAPDEAVDDDLDHLTGWLPATGATTRLPLDPDGPHDPTERLAVAGSPDEAAATRVLRVEPQGGSDRTEIFAALREDDVEAPVAERAPRRSRWRRNLAIVVVGLALLSAGIIALWPAVTSIVDPPRPEAPTYPIVEGALGEDLLALQESVGGDGLAYEAQETLQNDVLAVAEAAAAPDYSAASSALELTISHLDLAATTDQVTSARYRDVLDKTGPVSESIEAAIQAAEEEERRLEEERLAEEERLRQQELEEEQQRLEEERQQQEEEQQQLEEEQNEGTLDEIGESIRDQWERWWYGRD